MKKKQAKVVLKAKAVKKVRGPEEVIPSNPPPPSSLVEDMLFKKIWSGQRLTVGEQQTFFNEQEQKFKQLLSHVPGLPHDGIKRLLTVSSSEVQSNDISPRLRFLPGTNEKELSWYMTAVDAWSTLDWVKGYLQRLGTNLPPIQQRAIFMAFSAGAKLTELHARVLPLLSGSRKGKHNSPFFHLFEKAWRDWHAKPKKNPQPTTDEIIASLINANEVKQVGMDLVMTKENGVEFRRSISTIRSNMTGWKKLFAVCAIPQTGMDHTTIT